MFLHSTLHELLTKGLNFQGKLFSLARPQSSLFVLPTIGNPLGYLAAILIGSAIGCLILGLLKKNLKEEER